MQFSITLNNSERLFENPESSLEQLLRKFLHVSPTKPFTVTRSLGTVWYCHISTEAVILTTQQSSKPRPRHQTADTIIVTFYGLFWAVCGKKSHQQWRYDTIAQFRNVLAVCFSKASVFTHIAQLGKTFLPALFEYYANAHLETLFVASSSRIEHPTGRKDAFHISLRCSGIGEVLS